MPSDGVRVMPRSSMGRRDQTGFSLTELLFVVAIGLVVTATALPSMTTAIANARLRASMTSISGLLQNTRMVAVQQNKTKTALTQVRTNALICYIKNAGDTSAVETSDSQVELEAPITAYTTPSGTGAPSEVSTTTLSFTPQTGDPSFNSRGLPCAYSSGICTASVGFIKYFKDNRISGAGGWAAISISPAGRIKRWFWNGSAWTD